MVAFRRCSNISDFLVRAKLDTDLSKPKTGSFRYNVTKCTTYPYIENVRNKYKYTFFHATGKTYSIKSNIISYSSVLISFI